MLQASILLSSTSGYSYRLDFIVEFWEAARRPHFYPHLLVPWPCYRGTEASELDFPVSAAFWNAFSDGLHLLVLRHSRRFRRVLPRQRGMVAYTPFAILWGAEPAGWTLEKQSTEMSPPRIVAVAGAGAGIVAGPEGGNIAGNV